MMELMPSCVHNLHPYISEEETRVILKHMLQNYWKMLPRYYSQGNVRDMLKTFTTT